MYVQSFLRFRYLIVTASHLLPHYQHLEFVYGIVQAGQQAVIVSSLGSDQPQETGRTEGSLGMQEVQRGKQTGNLFEVAKEELEFLQFLEGYVLEVNSSNILSHTVREQFVHHPLDIRYPAYSQPELLQQFLVTSHILYRIKSLIDLIDTHQRSQQPFLQQPLAEVSLRIVYVREQCGLLFWLCF